MTEPAVDQIRARLGAVIDRVARNDIEYLLAALDAERMVSDQRMHELVALRNGTKPTTRVTWINDGRTW